MHPFIELFGRQLPAYWVLCMLGAGAAAVFALLNRQKTGLAADDTIHLLLYGAIGAMLGAKFLYLTTILPPLIGSRKELLAHPDALAPILMQGYVFYGGLFGALWMARRYCRRYAVSLDGASMLFAGTAPLFHLFGRVGCFLAGCCYGVRADGWGVVYKQSLGAPNGIRLVPVQLFEAGVNLVIFAAVLLYQKYARRPGRSLALYLVSYAFCRFVLEFFRGDDIRGHVFGLSTSQWISLGIILYFTGRSILCGVVKTNPPIKPE